MPLAVEAESPSHWTTREVAQPKSLLREASDSFAMWHQLHEGNAVSVEGRGMPMGAFRSGTSKNYWSSAHPKDASGADL